jgi:hypothetical protein
MAVKKPKQPTAAQKRKAAETQLATIKAEAEAKLIAHQIALIESPQPVVPPWHEYPQFDTWGMPRYGGYEIPYLTTYPDDYTEGRYRPYYENAQDLRRMMAEWRAIARLPIAKSAIRKLGDYIIGNGWDFTVQPRKQYKKDAGAIQLAKRLQSVVDKILDYNRFIGNMDREIHKASIVDGNTFVTLYPEGNCIRMELTDPGCICEPVNKAPLEKMTRTNGQLNAWWHGIHTTYSHTLKRDDVSRPLGYHAVYDRLGSDWDYLEARQVKHIKRNVNASLARMGVGDFYFVMNELNSEAKIRRNTADGVAALAAIIMIREHAEGVSRSTIENMVSTRATNDYQKQTKYGSVTAYQEQLQPGTVKDVSAGMKHFLGPMGTLNQPVYIEISNAILRILGSIWSMAGFMMTGDASEGSYSNFLVAESPFVKYCEHEQGVYGQHYEEILWMSLRLLRDCGQLGYDWAQIAATIEIVSEYTSPASRDKLQQAQANQILNEAGILSDRGWAADMGLDYDDEQEQIAKQPKEPAPKIVLPPNPNGPMQPPQGVPPRLAALAEHAIKRFMERAS